MAKAKAPEPKPLTRAEEKEMQKQLGIFAKAYKTFNDYVNKVTKDHSVPLNIEGVKSGLTISPSYSFVITKKKNDVIIEIEHDEEYPEFLSVIPTWKYTIVCDSENREGKSKKEKEKPRRRSPHR